MMTAERTNVRISETGMEYSTPSSSEMMQGTAYCRMSVPMRSVPKN